MSANVLYPLPGPAAERPERETTPRTVVLGLPGIPVTQQRIHEARREGKRVLIDIGDEQAAAFQPETTREEQ